MEGDYLNNLGTLLTKRHETIVPFHTPFVVIGYIRIVGVAPGRKALLHSRHRHNP